MISAIFFIMVCGVLNWGYAYVLTFLLTVVFRPVIEKRNMRCNYLLKPEMWLLLLFGVTYFAFGTHSFSFLTNYCILPVVAYIIGWSAAENAEISKLKNYLIAIALGFSAYAALNFFANAGNTRYELIDFWTGEIRAATGSGFLNTIMVSMLFYMLFLEKRRLVKFILLVIFTVSMLYMFMLGTRTQFLILLAVLFISAVVYSYERSGINGLIRIVFVFLISAALISVAYSINLFGIKRYIIASNLIGRYQNTTSLSLSDDMRFTYFITGIKELFLYPLGGRGAQPYRHNLWLDVARIAGFLPFIFIVAYSVKTWINMWRVYRNKKYDDGFRYLVFAVYIGVFLNFFVEPIMEGMINFFLAFCVINGMVDCVSYRTPGERLHRNNNGAAYGGGGYVEPITEKSV